MRKTNESETEQMKQVNILFLVGKIAIFSISAFIWVGTSVSLGRPENFGILSLIALVIGIVCFFVNYALHILSVNRRNLEFIAGLVSFLLAVLLLVINNHTEMYIFLAGYTAGLILADLAFYTLGKKSLNTRKSVAPTFCICILLCAFTAAMFASKTRSISSGSTSFQSQRHAITSAIVK